MKDNLFKITILLVTLILKVHGQNSAKANVIIEGLYTGKNLIVKNANCTSFGYCIEEIKTNGLISPATIAEEIIEVPLHLLEKVGIKIGDSVKVEIRYKLACSPKSRPEILNPGAILSYSNKSDNKMSSFTIDGEFVWGTLFIFNSYSAINKTFGLKEIKINGKNFNTNLNKEILALDLKTLGQSTVFNSEAEEKASKEKGGLKEGDNVQIEFIYLKDSDPIILNPDLITPLSTKK